MYASIKRRTRPKARLPCTNIPTPRSSTRVKTMHQNVPRFLLLDTILLSTISLISTLPSSPTSYKTILLVPILLTPLLTFTRSFNKSTLSSTLLVRHLVLSAAIALLLHYIASESLDHLARHCISSGDFRLAEDGVVMYQDFKSNHPVTFNHTIAFIMSQRSHLQQWSMRKLTWLQDKTSPKDYLDLLDMFHLLPDIKFLHNIQQSSSGILRPPVKTIIQTSYGTYETFRALPILPFLLLAKFLSWRSMTPHVAHPRSALTAALITSVSICAVRAGTGAHWAYGVFEIRGRTFEALSRITIAFLATIISMTFVAVGSLLEWDSRIVWMIAAFLDAIVETFVVIAGLVFVPPWVRGFACLFGVLLTGILTFSVAVVAMFLVGERAGVEDVKN